MAERVLNPFGLVIQAIELPDLGLNIIALASFLVPGLIFLDQLMDYEVLSEFIRVNFEKGKK